MKLEDLTLSVIGSTSCNSLPNGTVVVKTEAR